MMKASHISICLTPIVLYVLYVFSIEYTVEQEFDVSSIYFISPTKIRGVYHDYYCLFSSLLSKLEYSGQEAGRCVGK